MKRIILIMASLLLVGCGDGSSGSSSGDIGPTGTGQGGSYSTFSIVNNNLYVMDGTNIVGFDLNAEGLPESSTEHHLTSPNGETLFNYKNTHLLVGKNSGVEVVAIDNEGKMSFVSEYRHFTACDPVVAQGNRAFTTLSAGSDCPVNRGVEERLDILNISDIDNPVLIKSISMRSPKGLAVQGDTLFVCAFDGLTQFEITDTEDNFDLTEVYINDHYPCTDIILSGEHMILTHSRGITQLNFINKEVTFLSEIETGVLL